MIAIGMPFRGTSLVRRQHVPATPHGCSAGFCPSRTGSSQGTRSGETSHGNGKSPWKWTFWGEDFRETPRKNWKPLGKIEKNLWISMDSIVFPSKLLSARLVPNCWGTKRLGVDFKDDRYGNKQPSKHKTPEITLNARAIIGNVTSGSEVLGHGRAL